MIRASRIAVLSAAVLLHASVAMRPARADESIACNQFAQYDASTTGATRLITGAAKTKIYVCGYTIFGGGTANFSFKTGTGTNCATGTAALTPAFNMVAQAKVEDTSPFWRGMFADIATDVCFNASGAVAAQAIIYYTQR